MRLLRLAVIGIALVIGLRAGDAVMDLVERLLPGPVAILAGVSLVLAIGLQDEWSHSRVHARNRWLLHLTSGVLLLGGVIGPLIRFGL